MNARNETAGIQEYSDEQVGITAKCVYEGHVNRDAKPRTNDSGPEKNSRKARRLPAGRDRFKHQSNVFPQRP